MTEMVIRTLSDLLAAREKYPHEYAAMDFGLIETILTLLKEQAHEINRLKHHIDCNAAEKIPAGCLGYSYDDDEPCEVCKMCEKHDLYGEE